LVLWSFGPLPAVVRGPTVPGLSPISYLLSSTLVALARGFYGPNARRMIHIQQFALIISLGPRSPAIAGFTHCEAPDPKRTVCPVILLMKGWNIMQPRRDSTPELSFLMSDDQKPQPLNVG
jgi:hypothetical protein